MLLNIWPILGALAGTEAGRAAIFIESLGDLGLSADTGRPEWGTHRFWYLSEGERRQSVWTSDFSEILAQLFDREIDKESNFGILQFAMRVEAAEDGRERRRILQQLDQGAGLNIVGNFKSGLVDDSPAVQSPARQNFAVV